MTLHRLPQALGLTLCLLSAPPAHGLGSLSSDTLLGSPLEGSISMTPDGSFIATTQGGSVFRLTQGGVEEWETDLGDTIYGGAAVNGSGVAYVGGASGEVYALDASGTESWSTTLSGSIVASPSLSADGTLYVGTLSDDLCALDSAGNLLWTLELGGDIRTSPAVGLQGNIYVGADDGRIYGVDSGGAQLWSFQTGGRVRGSVFLGEDGTVYVGSDDDYLYALSPEGALLWRQRLGGNVRSGGAFDDAGDVYIGDGRGDLFKLDGESGAVLFEVSIGGGIWTSPIIDEAGQVIVNEEDGDVVGLSQAGAEAWRISLGAGILEGSSPALSDAGLLALGGQDGRLYIIDGGEAAGLLPESPWPAFGQHSLGGRHPLDSDDDGAPDWFETRHGQDPLDPLDGDDDDDLDGLDLAAEALYNSDPADNDSDGDTLSDGDEVNTHGSSPTSSDSDGDSLNDGDEVNTHGSSPILNDSDGDGLSDDEEVSLGLDPTDFADGDTDTDGDGFGALAESLAGTDPTNPSSFPTGGEEAFSLPAFSPTWGGPAICDSGVTYVGSFDGKLRAVGPGGDLLWTYQAQGPIVASPTTTETGSVLVSSLDGTLSSLTSQGALSWSFDLPGAPYGGVAIAEDGAIVFGTSDGLLYALESTGTLRWSVDLESPIFDAPSIAPSGNIHIGLDSGELVTLDATGSELWRYNTGRALRGSPALDLSGNIYIGSEDRRLYAISEAGALQWRYRVGGIITAPPIITVEGNVVVGSEDGYLYAFDSSGAPLWQFETGGALRGGAAESASGDIFLASGDGSLYGISNTGGLLWTVALGEPLYPSIALGDTGLILLSPYSGGLVAVHSGSPLGAGPSPWPMDHQNPRNTGRFLDSDGDGMGDGWEALYGLDPEDPGDAALDGDSDGLTNYEEFHQGTDPTNSDSDGDTLTDGDELNTYGTDPLNTDSDDDGLGDGDEVNTHGTDPADFDSDDDWISDGDELGYGFDPLNGADGAEDADSDGFSNQVEDAQGTDPLDNASQPSLGTTNDWDLGEATFGDDFEAITFSRTFTNPLILLGPPGTEDSEPGVIRSQNISGDGAELRFQEWDYLDGVHGDETGSYLVMEPGLYQLPGGGLAEVGSFTLTDCYAYDDIAFSTQFPGAPKVFLTIQGVGGLQAVTARIGSVDASGFSARLFEQESFMDAHLSETIAYLALYTEAQSGTLDIGGSALDFELYTSSIGTEWAPQGDGMTLRIEEETSFDAETNHAEEEIAVLKLGGQLFAQDQSVGGENTITLRSFIRDLDTLGPLETGTLTSGDQFTSVLTQTRFADPVLLMSPPTDTDAEPGVWRVQGLGQLGFEARFQEWDYLDGVHGDEDADWMIFEAGRYESIDGTIIEAGTIELTDTYDWATTSFSEAFPGVPSVFLTVSSYDGVQGVGARVDAVTATSFDAILYEQEAFQDTHATEEVSYLAIYLPGSGGTVDLPTGDEVASIQSLSLDDSYTPIFSDTFKLEEDQSLNTETSHAAEDADVLTFAGVTLAQTQSLGGVDPYSIRRRYPEIEANITWGTAYNVGDEGSVITLKESFTNPIIIARPSTFSETPTGTVRVYDIGENSFTLRFDPFEAAEIGAEVQVLYVVAEEGSGTLGGLAYQAGSAFISDTFFPTSASRPWNGVTFPSSFSGAPQVLTQVMSDNDATAVTTRIDAVDANGFDVLLQESEIESDTGQPHSPEDVGWIAIEAGQGLTAGGRLVWVTNLGATHEYTELLFPAAIGANHPIAVADMQTTIGIDSAVARLQGIDDLGVFVTVREETTVTPETVHTTESIGVLTLE